MKILWITNILFPEAISFLTTGKELKSSGGWLLGAANILVKQNDIELTVATVSTLVTKLEFIKGHTINYYVIPYGKGNDKYNLDYEKYWIEIRKHLSPDIVHIHGSEFSHGLAYVNACGSDNVVLSIQGLKSVYSPYYHYGISDKEVMKHITLHDILSRSMFKEKKMFCLSGILEKKLICKINHIIGRTSWDRAHTWAINPDASYYFCNETLRDEFYDGSRWNYEKCNKHSIFLSQAGYAIKGLHQMLKALPLILRHYPDTCIRIAGQSLMREKGISGLKHYSGYKKYINNLIKKYHLENNILFTGSLSAEQMKQEYLKANVFVCPSSIENSPNSLGEAQLLGVPCISSYIGGAMDMMVGNECNLYRFEEIEMLAYKVCEIFSNKENQINMSSVAKERHSREKNCLQLIKIYKTIIK